MYQQPACGANQLSALLLVSACAHVDIATWAMLGMPKPRWKSANIKV